MKFSYVLLFVLAIGLVGGILGFVYTPSSSPIKPVSVGIFFFFVVAFLPPFIMEKYFEKKEREEGGWLAPIDKPGAKISGYILGLILAALLCRLIIFSDTIFVKRSTNSRAAN